MNPERVSVGEEREGRSFHVDGPMDRLLTLPKSPAFLPISFRSGHRVNQC